MLQGSSWSPHRRVIAVSKKRHEAHRRLDSALWLFRAAQRPMAGLPASLPACRATMAATTMAGTAGAGVADHFDTGLKLSSQARQRPGGERTKLRLSHSAMQQTKARASARARGRPPSNSALSDRRLWPAGDVQTATCLVAMRLFFIAFWDRAGGPARIISSCVPWRPWARPDADATPDGDSTEASEAEWNQPKESPHRRGSPMSFR